MAKLYLNFCSQPSLRPVHAYFDIALLLLTWLLAKVFLLLDNPTPKGYEESQYSLKIHFLLPHLVALIREPKQGAQSMLCMQNAPGSAPSIYRYKDLVGNYVNGSCLRLQRAAANQSGTYWCWQIHGLMQHKAVLCVRTTARIQNQYLKCFMLHPFLSDGKFKENFTEFPL